MALPQHIAAGLWLNGEQDERFCGAATGGIASLIGVTGAGEPEAQRDVLRQRRTRSLLILLSGLHLTCGSAGCQPAQTSSLRYVFAESKTLSSHRLNR